MDVHGAGAQRADNKAGGPREGSAGVDLLRGENFVRCVKGEANPSRFEVEEESDKELRYE